MGFSSFRGWQQCFRIEMLVFIVYSVVSINKTKRFIKLFMAFRKHTNLFNSTDIFFKYNRFLPCIFVLNTWLTSESSLNTWKLTRTTMKFYWWLRRVHFKNFRYFFFTLAQSRTAHMSENRVLHFLISIYVTVLFCCNWLHSKNVGDYLFI